MLPLFINTEKHNGVIRLLHCVNNTTITTTYSPCYVAHMWHVAVGPHVAPTVCEHFLLQ